MRTEFCRTRMCGDIDKYVAEGCISEERGEEMKRDSGFRDENEVAKFSGISESALRPLRREQDPEIQQKVIALVAKGGERKKDLYGTEKKMKAALARYHDVEPEKPKPKEKKLWGAVEQAEYVQAFVRTMIKNGVEAKVIRELVVKAIGVVEQE